MRGEVAAGFLVQAIAPFGSSRHASDSCRCPGGVARSGVCPICTNANVDQRPRPGMILRSGHVTSGRRRSKEDGPGIVGRRSWSTIAPAGRRGGGDRSREWVEGDRRAAPTGHGPNGRNRDEAGPCLLPFTKDHAMKSFDRDPRSAARAAPWLAGAALAAVSLAGRHHGLVGTNSSGGMWWGPIGGSSSLLILTAALAIMSIRAPRPTGAPSRSAGTPSRDVGRLSRARTDGPR